jgi:cytochrome c551/c552
MKTSSIFSKLALVILVGACLFRATALDIQLPPETGAFRQDKGAEIANGQCLICHSVEYVVMQPSMPRTFWKSSVQKMQQKYGAPIPDDQVEAVVDYLTKNYGVGTNGTVSSTQATVQTQAPAQSDGPKVAARYGCFGCHNTSMKVIGPAYKEIAAKYKADPDAFGKIDQQIHKGGSGKWGYIIMPPFPQITAAETKILADWILGLK